MANHSFAKLDDNNLVLSVLAVDDADCNNGDEATGASFLTNLTGWSKWKMVAADDAAYIGGTYDDTNGFRPKQPADDYVWNSEYKCWIDPEDQAAGRLPE